MDMPVMTKREIRAGLIYLPVQLLVLPALLAYAAYLLLPVPPSDGKINFLFFCINFLFIIVIFHRFLAQSLRAARWGRVLFCAVWGFAAYLACNLFVSPLLLWLIPDFANVNDAAISVMAQQDYALIACGTVLLVPLTEELLYRGLLFGALYRRHRILAYAVSMAFFAAIHVLGYIGLYPAKLLLACFLQYLPAGLCLAWAYAHSGSIFAPVLLHTVINFIGISSMR